MILLINLVSIAVPLILIFLACKAFPRQKITIFIISLILVIMFIVIFHNSAPRVSITCEDLLQHEAQLIESYISDYFSVPEHTKTPTLNDLIERGYIPPDRRKSPRKSYSVNESDLKVSILGEINEEIEIWVIAGEDECNAGKAWVYYINRQEGEWEKNY